jgi:hypothetical protein
VTGNDDAAIMKLRTCVSPSGKFIYGVHQPRYRVKNFREADAITALGTFEDGSLYENHGNFPTGDVEEPDADWIFEIPNAFPFRGTTYISKSWADPRAADPLLIALDEPPPVSYTQSLKLWLSDSEFSENYSKAFSALPEPLLLALAATSTDPADLVFLAEFCCDFVRDPSGRHPVGLTYTRDEAGHARAAVRHPVLFEVLANNIHLPDAYKNAMVLKPGVQGGSEIIGESRQAPGSCVFEYLRRNSYIPWGHYAANMSDGSVRYHADHLTLEDIAGLRHLYYQRTFTRVAEQLDLPLPPSRKPLSRTGLETLREALVRELSSLPRDAGPGDADSKKPALQFNATLWGWNYGFDFAPSRYRLHASHQQIHQQFAMIPATVPVAASRQLQASDNVRFGQEEEPDPEMLSYSCGDLVSEFIQTYREQTGQGFFEDYIHAIRNNQRLDRDDEKENSLIVHEDEQVMVFVPKAQTSQWEIQLMVKQPAGNIIETESAARDSLDKAILITMKILTAMGARMITVIEYAKRIDSPVTDQHLLYAFLPKMPESPGAFSEAQLRWINGHYPEDFAAACRARLRTALES